MNKPFSFILDNKPLIAKKFSPKETLDNVRSEMKNKLNNSISFLYDEAPIDINDENKYCIEEIEKSGKIFLTYNTSIVKSYKIYLNEEFLTDYKGNEDEKLINIRKNLGDRINLESYFLFNDSKIEKENKDGEDCFTIRDIEKEGVIYINQKKKREEIKEPNEEIIELGEKKENIKKKKIEIREEEENNKKKYMFFNQNKNIFSLLFAPETPLYIVRKEIKKNMEEFKNYVFLKSIIEITKEEEFETEIKDIEENGIIFLKLITEGSTPQDAQDEKEKEIPSDNEKNKNKEKQYYFEIEGGNKFMEIFEPNDDLSYVREKLSDKITNDFVFIHNGYDIDQKNESQLTLALIESNSQIKIKKALNISPAPSLMQNKPLPGSILKYEMNGLKIYKYPDIKYNDEEELRAISLIVVGQTGSGKTTLLNSFVNFLTGIKIEDDFRYQIIFEKNYKKQSKSVTQTVNLYRIAAHGNYPPIKIIDTPGYGDTRGIKRDHEITELIKQKFEKEINTLNAICFVAQSSNARLTPNQKYIFSSIIDLFGNDVAENFIVMMTFCDGQEPQLKAALISQESIFKNIIKLIKYPWYLKFNNSAIFASNKNDAFNELFWKLGMDSFNEFMKKLQSLPTKSLNLTKEVLDKRKLLKTTVEGLIPQLNLGLGKLDSIRQQLEKIDLERKKIDDSKNFVILSDVPKITKIDLNPGEYVTNCLVCNYTCHYPCYIKDDNKNNCSAMNNNVCTVCPKKCSYTEHRNAKFRLEIEIIKKKTNLKELEKKYINSKSNLSKYEQIRKGLVQEFEDIQIKCLNIQNDIKKCVDRLKQIGLNSNPYSDTEYIDLLIESEKNQKKAGYLGRINGLESLKKIYITIKNAYEAQNTIKEFEQFQEKYLKQLNERNEELQKQLKGENKDDEKNVCLIY